MIDPVAVPYRMRDGSRILRAYLDGLNPRDDEKGAPFGRLEDGEDAI